MRRGDLYCLRRPGERDPKRSRVFVVASRQTLIDSRFSTVICAPVYTRREGLATEVAVGIAEGLKHDSSLDFSLNKRTARYVKLEDPTGSRRILQQAVRSGADTL